jgi:hypothetical protein
MLRSISYLSLLTLKPHRSHPTRSRPRNRIKVSSLKSSSNSCKWKEEMLTQSSLIKATSELSTHKCRHRPILPLLQVQLTRWSCHLLLNWETLVNQETGLLLSLLVSEEYSHQLTLHQREMSSISMFRVLAQSPKDKLCSGRTKTYKIEQTLVELVLELVDLLVTLELHHPE